MDEISIFFETSLHLLNLSPARPGIAQQIISNLATEDGLVIVNEVTVILGRCPEVRRVSCFSSLVLPFLRSLTHKDIISSLLLETKIGTIYNVLYGVGGARAAGFFRTIATILASLPVSDEIFQLSVAAVLAALLKLLDCNQSASVNPDIQDVFKDIKASAERAQIDNGSLSMQSALRSLSKIDIRLGQSNSIPLFTNEIKDILTPAMFDLGQDGPGNLSAQGPRHDNDHADISLISIMPTAQEIKSERPEYLPTTNLHNHHLAGIQGLCDRQFRLLREDTIGQLRNCVASVLGDLTSAKENGGSIRKTDDAFRGTRVFVYDNVLLPDIIFDMKKGLRFAAEFDQPGPAKKLATEMQRRSWWDESKRLQIDSLLCLVDSDGRTVFLYVAEREERKFEPDGTISSIPHSMSLNLWSDRQRSTIILQLVDMQKQEILEVLSRSQNESLVRNVLVEFPGILLPSFRPTLEALQRMSKNFQDVPFSQLIALSPESGEGGEQGMADIPPPTYALQRGFSFNLGAISKGAPLRLQVGTRFNSQDLMAQTSLDVTQCQALINGLTRSFALIQGPPGTGKSFVAVQMVRVLLASRTQADLGPIVCV